MSDALQEIYKIVLGEKAKIRLIRTSNLSMTFGMRIPDKPREECITIPIK